MTRRRAAVLPTPLPGGLLLALWFEGKALVSIDFIDPGLAPFAEKSVEADLVIEALTGYFEDPASSLPLPQVETGGTTFQRRVWQALRAIPCGETRSYGQLASMLGSSPRAVAGACRANPITLLIPCHRVVAANGPGGYMGQTEGQALAIKRWLLHHEQDAGRYPDH